MAQWGTGDDHANSVSYAPQQFKVEANTANRQALYGNTTADAFVTGTTIGQFAVDTNEIAASGGKQAHTGWVLQTTGSGGRAGRITSEVLVAGGISSDGSDDAVMRDFTTTILTQPSNASANTTASESATFTVAASTIPAGGSQSFAWTFADGSAITAGTNTGVTTAASLVIASAQQSTNASYKCTVSVTGGDAVVSSNATLTITT
jgi:hypothetical protein|tara:strand:- start:2539 stop:3156 length:618 start_codon:yes stop_codon:yes gene_type:complete